MTLKTISIEDLMAECHLSDTAEFRRLLRRRGLTISFKKPVKREDANKIVNAFTGKSIDWFKYDQKGKDQSYEGPLQKKWPVDSYRVEEWYQKLPLNVRSIVPNKDCLLGIVFTGGFLGGTDGAEFILGLEPGINILIGDRGAGKSTVLNLLGVISGSVSEKTNVLINKLLQLLKINPEEIEVTRQVRRVLKQYGIERYACYYIKGKKLFCYYVNISETAYEILERSDETWHPVEAERGIIRPKMQALLQGEVIRIAEEKEKYYLNNILDSLCADLYGKREVMARTIKKVSTQSEFYKPNAVQVNTYKIDQFIAKRYQELRGIISDIRRRRLSDESIKLISGYITKIHGIDRHALPPTIAQLLRLDEDAFYQLYLGRIVPFLSELAGQLEHLREEQSAFLNEELYSRLDESQNYESPFAGSEIMEELNADKEVLAEIESAELVNEEGGTDSLILSQEASLFLEALEAESNNPVNRKLIAVGRKIVDLLETRLRILRTWTRIFARPRLEWTPSLTALIESCTQLLRERVELISLQEKHCQRITKILNDDELEITIFTGGVRGAVIEHQRDIQGLNRLTALYQKLFSATPSLRLRELQRASVACDDYLDRLRSILQIVEGVMESNQQHEFLFIPIEIDLRQGGTYRNFTQLSFGQKSGIILNMVLLTTNEGIIIIDQPEDNLDANSIATLVPTFNRLGKKRQIILATHNSNLVLALNSKNVVVLESQGDAGKIKTSGSPLKSKTLVREMMDILEGGVDTFDLKIKVYDEFITRVRGEIQDIDIQLIENSFRRRTIDNLRNILQPIVSDKSILDFARHELKNILQPFLSDKSILDVARNELEQHGGILPDPGESLKPVEDNKEVNGLERARLIVSLDKLSGQLDSHIKRLMRSISDISLMDTQPQPKDLELYTLLIELKEDYLERVSRKRTIQIEIDEQLKGRQVYADIDHLRLIFRNLFNNSFRATETRVIQNRRSGQKFTESIGIQLLSDSNSRLTILLMDNGCGIPSWIKERLYFERCSDQDGGDHGLGGVIIRKLLDLNGGAIQVLVDYPSANQFVTTQQITLPESKHRDTFKYE